MSLFAILMEKENKSSFFRFEIREREKKRPFEFEITINASISLIK